MNRKGLLSIDWFIILPVGILLIISLATLFSLNPDFFKSQFVFLLISIFAFLFFSQTNLKSFKFYAKPVYIVSLILLSIVLFLGIESRGSLRWIEIFGVRAQFSEILKPFLAISLATYMADKKSLSFRSFIEIFLLLAPIALLIFLEPDLGDALIYCGVVISLILYYGFPIRYMFGLFLPVLAIFPVVWKFFLHNYQKQRILTFIDPGKDPLGTSYNVIQSIIAVGSGELFGKGLGQGTQSGLSFLPERHTDFIFATIAEQLGFVGTVIILICFAFLLYKIYMIFINSDDKFYKTFSALVFFTFLIQIFINIGMNIGIVPAVGVTLPFVSYGGSSLLSNFIFLGLLVSITRISREQEVLEIK